MGLDQIKGEIKLANQSISEEKGFLFGKKNKVSVWASQMPYEQIPDEYFDEKFSKKDTRATNQWSNNFKLRYFKPDMMETNGSHTDLISIEKAAGECSFSSSVISVLMSKARKKKLENVSWIVLLFELEYSVKLTGVESDDYLNFLGAFDYDDDADSLYEVDDTE